VSDEQQAEGDRGASAQANDDAELAAAKGLHEKIQHARKRASLAAMLSGLVLGFVLAFALQKVLADQLGPRFGTLALVIVFFAPLLAALTIAGHIADSTVKGKIDGWIAELAKTHNVSASTLEDHARIAGAIEAP
jgi:hypothetical protein